MKTMSFTEQELILIQNALRITSRLGETDKSLAINIQEHINGDAIMLKGKLLRSTLDDLADCISDNMKL